jgi:L-lysine 2,3-aminomutase
LSNERLEQLLLDLEQIPHVQRIRFHTRFLIGIPERIDAELLHIFKSSQKKIVFVIHCNHAKELDDDVVSACQALHSQGILLYNQSVLLKGVNDNEQILLDLSEALLAANITPYYLHLMDPVQGADHFIVSQERGLELIHHLQSHLCGFGVPRLVREIPGSASKTWIFK